MKPFVLIIFLFLIACVCPKQQKKAYTGIKNLTTPENISISEQIKPYAVGRYVDPIDPHTLHERHTVYRREQSENWNLASVQGPAASRSYYLTADTSQQNAQQRAYYQAAQEQTRSAQEKLSTAEQKIAALEKENRVLKERSHSPLLYPNNP